MSLQMKDRVNNSYDGSEYTPVLSQPQSYGYPPAGAPAQPYPGAPAQPYPGAPAQQYHQPLNPEDLASKNTNGGYPSSSWQSHTPFSAPQGLGGAPAILPPPLAPNCPPGLQYLTTIDQILIQQTIEIFEAFTGFETNNKYKIKNSLGQKIFMAKEDTDCCTRQCCGPLRPFNMTICDLSGNEVVHLYRPLACQACCFPCCLQTLEVQSPPGTVIGTIEQEWSILYPKFTIKDETGEPVLKISGPCWTCSCFGDVDFKVLSATDPDKQVGTISKQWSGIGKELFTDTDNFGVNFPLDLSVKMKATLMGAVFLIDFMYFETKNQNNDN